MGKRDTQSENYSKSSNTIMLHWLINTFNRTINLRMYMRTHNEFGSQFPHKRLPKFANKTGLSIRQKNVWDTMKSLPMVNKESHCFFCGASLWHEKKLYHICQMANKKTNSGEMEFWTFGKVSNKIYTNYFPRVFSNTKGYKEEEPSQTV